MSNNDQSVMRTRTTTELERALSTQISLLQNTAKQYDSGFQESAILLSTILRTLLWKDSLLSKIGIQDSVDVLSTAYPYEETNLLTQFGLLFMHMSGSKGEFLPHLDNGNRHICKCQQWMDEIVICDKYRNLFSRADLIRVLTNKDGGAHVDKKIPKDYNDLRESNSINWEMITADGVKPLDNDIVYASIRQMAYEILASLYNYNSSWFTEKYF